MALAVRAPMSQSRMRLKLKSCAKPKELTTMKKSRKPGDKKARSYDPSRRSFLKGVGIAGAGAAVADTLWVEAGAKENIEQPQNSRVLSGTVSLVLEINGEKRTAQVEPRTTLLNTLRNHLDPAITG